MIVDIAMSRANSANNVTRLLEQEDVIWEGRPDWRVLFAAPDTIIIPVSVLAVVETAIKWTWTPFLPRLVGLVLLTYVVFLRLIVKVWIKHRSIYIITATRIVLERNGRIYRQMNREDLRSVTTSVIRFTRHRSALFHGPEMRIDWLGNVTVITNMSRLLVWLFSNTGFDCLVPFITLGSKKWRDAIDPIRFVDVYDRDALFQIVTTMSKGL